MTGTPQPLDLMAIVPERRLTRPLAINIALGSATSSLNDDDLRVTSIEGQEGVSELYQFNVELRANEDNPSDVSKIDAQGQFASQILAEGKGSYLLGKWAQLRVAMPYDLDRFAHLPDDDVPSWEDATPSRFFCGIITTVSHSAPGEYHLVVQSPLYPLTLRNRYCIHKDKNTESLITQLLNSQTLKYSANFNVQFKLEGATITRSQDWLQAGESDFNFLHRVMAKACIHFYFIHEKDQLTVVFSNQTTSVQEVAIPGSSSNPLPLRYSYTDMKSLGNQQSDLFSELKYEVKMVQEATYTVLTHQHAVWETNSVATFESYVDEVNNGQTESQYTRYRAYGYGVDGDEATGQETKICQQLATEEGTLTGSSSTPLLSPGYTFKLTQTVITDGVSASRMPAQFDERVFVVTKITHKASDKESYSGTIEATEVDPTATTNQETLITPFDMQSTHQGSILAKVLKTAVPKDWRYRDKNNFATNKSSVSFAGIVKKEIGCLVEFATDKSQHWVALSPTSQTAPEVHAMVSIGRAGNESEIPEIQQVLSSHGQKTIQPVERRTNHWTANTSWGSNYSTSYGDGISIRYGSESKVNLAQSIKIVENAYDKPGVLSTDYGNSSFNKGSSFSFSVSDSDADGLSNASVSAGCNFSESHSTQNYNVSYTGASQGYSKTNKSVNRSYMGTFSDTISYSSPSFIAGKIPQNSVITISDALPDGTNYSESYISGKTINFNYIGAPYAGGIPAAAPSYDQSATVYSNSTTVGKVVNISVQTGDTSSDSTTTGNVTHINVLTGDTTSTSTTTGDTTGTSTTVGDNTNTNTMTGDTTNTSTTTGDTTTTSTTVGDATHTSTTTGDTTSTSTTTGDNTSTNTMTGDTVGNSTTIGDNTNTSNTTGDVTTTNTMTGKTTHTTTTTGNSTNTSTTNGNTTTTSTTTGNTKNTNTVNGDNNATSTTTGNSTTKSTTIGLTSHTEMFLGLKNANSLSLAATNTNNLFLGATNDNALKLAAAVNTNLNLAGAMNLTMNGSADLTLGLSMSASLTLNTFLGISLLNDFNGGIKAQIQSGSPVIQSLTSLKAALKGIEADVVTLKSTM